MSTKHNLNRRSYTAQEFENYARQFRNWGRWGADDELGTANEVTPDRIARAAALVKRGIVHSLTLPLDREGPQTPAGPRVNTQHLMTAMPNEPVLGPDVSQAVADDVVYLALQGSTQWDALAHFYHHGQSYNGRSTDIISAWAGAEYNSITNLSTRAVGRGVLLDVARFLGRPFLEPGEAIQAELLEECAQSANVSIGPGDFVLVRTGHLQRRRAEGWGDYLGGPAPGLGTSAAEFFVPRDVTAVAVDTYTPEVLPFEVEGVICPLHVALMVNAGVHLGEMWDMESLSADCARFGVYEFFLNAAPLMVTGAVGSPINPQAIL